MASRPSWSSKLKNNTWTVELVAWLCSAGVCASIFAMLHYFDGRTVPHWQYDFNLNSVLSILSNALKGGVFVAVKAAIGQSKWLNSMKRHPLEDFTLYDNATRGIFGALNFLARIKFMGFAYLLVLLVVLGPLIDPAVQQSVTYPLRTIDVGESAVSVAQTYDDFSSGSIQAVKYPSTGMVIAVYNALLNGFANPASLQVAPKCPTGECSFEPYESLGVCSHCTNITNLLRNVPAASDGAKYGANCYNLSLPNGMKLGLGGGGTGQILSSRTGSLSSTQDMNYGAETIYNVSFITSMSTACSKAEAPQCVLAYCVKQYNASVQSANWKETMTSFWPNGSSPQVLNGSTVLNLLSPFSRQTYSIGRLAYVAISRSDNIGTYLTGNVTGDIGEVYATSDFVRLMSSNGNVTQTMENVALGMTQAIRQASTSTVSGVVYGTEPYVHVRWRWLVLPAVIEIAALILWLCIATVGRGKPLWKSSILPVFRCTVVDVTGSRLLMHEDVARLEKTAENLQVQLRYNPGNAALVS